MRINIMPWLPQNQGKCARVHCDKVLVKKNLPDHTKNAHKGKKVEFVSVLSKDIRNIFGPPPTKISKTVNDGTSSEDSILPSSDSFGDSSTSSFAHPGLAQPQNREFTLCNIRIGSPRMGLT